MKMLKKSLSVLLVVVMLLTAAPLSGFVGMEWPEVNYSDLNLPEWNLPKLDFSNIFASKAEAATSGTCGTNLTYTLDSDGVLTISGTGEMTNYSSPSSVPWYSNRASIKKVVIENGVTSIGGSMFYNCTSLTSVTIGDSVTSIGSSAFRDCTSLTSVTIGDSVTSIGDFAFYKCKSLTAIIIPGSVRIIGGSAFYYCTSLASITIPDSVTNIGDYAFYDTAYYKNQSNWVNSVLYIGNHLIEASTKITGSYAIKFGTKTIAVSAFLNCTSLTSVTIPDSVMSIGNKTFDYCNSLTSVTIPDSVTSIGDYAFAHCGSLTSVTIPDSVMSIGNKTFAYCNSLTSVTIPDSVTSIGDAVFSECHSLTSVIIGDSVTNIKEKTFYECTSLTSVTIGDNVTSIGDGAFYYCTKLTSVTIPDSVTSIGEDAFAGCKSLTTITFSTNSRLISIGDYAFINCTSLTSITIPDSVTSIEYMAFYNCTSLTSVTIGDSVTSIGRQVFCGCASLTSVTIGNSVMSIGDDAFKYCTSLTVVYITDLAAWCNIDFYVYTSNPLSYAHNLYLNGTLVTELTFPNTITEIKNYAFYGCSSLISITIPNSVTSIGYSAFKDCTSLNSITIPDSVTSIGSSAFYNCTSLTSVSIEDSVTSIGSSAFYNCTSLTSVSIGDSVTSIGSSAFKNCTSLADVYYAGSKEDWKKITIGSYNDCLTKAKIHYELIRGKLDNVIGVNYTFTYSDKYFDESAYTYNHDLAIMSNCLAITVMVEPEKNALPVTAEKFFEKIQFTNYKQYGYGVTPQINSIACVIASKNFDDENETLIAIGIRGGGYDAEWGGNFNVGTDEEHRGFRLAKEGVLNYLSSYIAAHKADFNDNIKFWISGYSRAAATSNLVAATLDEGASAYSEISALNYEPEDVYAYTFETPIPTRDPNTKNSLYKNIYNIINRIDYVPKVAPEAWDYSRYGVDCFLPSAETYGNYGDLLGKMKTTYKSMMGEEYSENFTYYDAKISIEISGLHIVPVYKVSFVEPNYNITQSRFLDELITLLANDVLKSVENYDANYQSSVQKLMVAVLGGGFKDDVQIPANTMKEIETALIAWIKEKILNPNSISARKSLAVVLSSIDDLELTYIDAYNLLGIVDELLVTSIGAYNYVYTLIENGADIKPAHYADMNFAWVAAMDGEEYTQTIGKYGGYWCRTYRVIKFNCPIDIKLYDDNNNLLAEMNGDEVNIAEDCYLSIYIDADGQKCFCLPEDTQYRFEITGNDKGTMNCSFSTYDFTTGKNTETVNYYDIPVENGEQFFVDVQKKADDGSNADVSLKEEIIITDENAEVIISDELLEEEKIIQVEVESESVNSIAIGGGSCKKGEFVKVEAFVADGETFKGWYIDDELVSAETIYRFAPEKDCTIIAKWETYCSINGHTEEAVPAIDSTCTQTGLTEGKKCSVCGEILVAQDEIPMIPHTDADSDGSCDICKQDVTPAYTLGDVDENGKIEAADARLALRAAVNLELLTEAQLSAADSDKNGKIEAADARLILRAAVGLETLQES